MLKARHTSFLDFLILGRTVFYTFCSFRSMPCFWLSWADVRIVVNYKCSFVLSILMIKLFWKCCVLSDIVSYYYLVYKLLQFQIRSKNPYVYQSSYCEIRGNQPTSGKKFKLARTFFGHHTLQKVVIGVIKDNLVNPFHRHDTIKSRKKQTKRGFKQKPENRRISSLPKFTQAGM